MSAGEVADSSWRGLKRKSRNRTKKGRCFRNVHGNEIFYRIIQRFRSDSKKLFVAEVNVLRK